MVKRRSYRMNYPKEIFNDNKENKKIAKQVSQEIVACIREDVSRHPYSPIIACYLLYKISFFNAPHTVSFEEVIYGKVTDNEFVTNSAKEFLDEKKWFELLKLSFKYNSEDFAKTVLSLIDEYPSFDDVATPDSVVILAKKILGVKNGDKVADICCGTGTYLISESFEKHDAELYGYEINERNKTFAEIKSDILNANIVFKCVDAFNLAEDTHKFDKIFSNYPFGLHLKNLDSGARYFENITREYPGLSKATSSDWIFSALVCDLLKENGKAIGIMTNGSTWNSIDMPMRRHFVERGMIESVISLPAKMFNFTTIPTTMVVFSHGNIGVRMIDATEICQQGRRQNTFSNEDIEKILKLFYDDSDNSKTISTKELMENEYALSLSRYMKGDIEFENAVPFENVIKNITRGAQCTAAQLDEIATEEKTNMQYLMLANIQNGMVDGNLPYLTEIDSKLEKYCLKDGDLILSKNGYPYKVAVASVKEGHKILANGNLYIIELDESKANPYYIKAFFESEQGIAVLKSITVGATVPNIGVDKLKKVNIPLLSIEEQNRFAEKYQKILEEIENLKSRLEEAKIKLQNVFNEK